MLKYYMLITASFILFTAQAQTIQSKIDRKVNDPDTKKNAAKADRHISRNGAIFDSTMTTRNADTLKDRKKARKPQRQ